MKEMVMTAELEIMDLSPTASLFRSLSKELAKSSETFNPNPDITKGELIKYPDVSLQNLSAAISQCGRLVKHHLEMSLLKPEIYGPAMPLIRDVLSQLGMHSDEFEKIMERFEAEVSNLIRIRVLVCGIDTLREAAHFCYLMHYYFDHIESKDTVMSKATIAMTRRMT